MRKGKNRFLALCVGLAALPLFFAATGCSFFNSTPQTSAGQAHTDAAVNTVKKGACVYRYNDGTEASAALINDLNIGWYYNWDCTDPDVVRQKGINAEFVPMIWGGFNVNATDLGKVKRGYDEGLYKYLLTFNEPDGTGDIGGSNVTLDNIVTSWRQLEEIGIPLSSPAYTTYSVDRAPSGFREGTNELDKFMKRAKQENLRVDFIALHHYSLYYNDDAVKNLTAVLQKVYDVYGLPVWLTEFGACDMAYNAQTNPVVKGTQKQAIDYMNTMCKTMERLGFVERYAWFLDNTGQHGAARDSALYNAKYTALFDDDDTLSATGKAYKQLVSYPALAFTSDVNLPEGAVGKAYNTTLTAAGGSGNYTLRTEADTLPAGLKFNSDGSITGTPTERGTFTLKVTVTDQQFQTATKVFRLVVA